MHRECNLNGKYYRAAKLAAVVAIVFALQSIFAIPVARYAQAQDSGQAAPAGQPREVVAVVPRFWPPQYQVDENGNPFGFAIDVMEAIAARANLTVDYIIKDNFPNAVDALRRGEADLIPNIGIAPERLDNFAFTAPVETFVISLFVRKDSGQISGVDDLVGQKLAVVERNVGKFMFSKRQDIEVEVFPDVRTALFALVAGQVEALVYPKPIILALARQAGIEDRIEVVGAPLKEIKRGIGVTKTNAGLLEVLNKEVLTFVGTATYQNIYKKWYGEPTPFWNAKRIVLSMSALVLVTLIAMAYWRFNSIVKLNRILHSAFVSQKRVEEALLDSRDQLRTVTDNLPVWIAYIDAQQRYCLANKTCTEWLARPVEDVVGRTSSELLGQEYEKVQPEIERALAGEQRNYIQTLSHPDGVTRTVQATNVPHQGLNGSVIGFFSLISDITEMKQSEKALRESEERIRALIDNLPNGISLKDIDGQFVHLNERAAEIFRLPQDDDLGQTSAELLTRDQLANFEEADRAIIEGQRDSFSDTLNVLRPDGQEHIYNLTKFPVFDADANPAGVGTISTDITDTMRTEEMLRQAQKMEAVGQLTGGVAHDFNNLLAVVIGNLELVIDHFAATSQVETPAFNFVRNAFNAAEHGASLTHHLLAFARQQVLRPEETDLAKLIVDTKALMSVSMGDKITVELKTDDDLWLCKVDQVQLQNAILNLSINARDAMPSGGFVTIGAENTRLNAERAEDLELAAGDYVCLSVSDNGPGIPEDVLEHVYEPFFTTKDVGEGSGLGLSMVYGFAQQSDGGVEIETSEGEGTSVKLYFPAIVSATETATENAASPLSELTEPDATILLVEDNAAFREITRTILESLNFQVIEIGSAEEALSVVDDTTPFDLLLSDIGLPGDMNGHDLAEHAMSARPGLKIVLMSAHADIQLNGGIMDPNVAAFLPKPHRKAELAQTLRQVL